MGRTESDTLRREKGVIIKHIAKKDESIGDYCYEIPQGGCRYYGNTELMMVYCPKCVLRNCY